MMSLYLNTMDKSTETAHCGTCIVKQIKETRFLLNLLCHFTLVGNVNCN